MNVTADQPALVIEAEHKWLSLQLGDLWHYTVAIVILTWHDIRLRNEQLIVTFQ